jgi:ribosomal protein S24E
MLEVLQKSDLLKKVIAISADNIHTNFGGKKRKGKNHLYFKMQENI